MEKRERKLIPLPSAVRERLAQNYKEAELLRRQLRVSEDAAVEANRRLQPEISRFWKGAKP
jgi:hypothetical protein